MGYQIIVKETQTKEIVLDTNTITTDEMLFRNLGRWAVRYFLSLDSVDYQDEQWFNVPQTEKDARLLYFTCHKSNDNETAGHRHGLNRNVLAYGSMWFYGEEKEVTIYIEEK